MRRFLPQLIVSAAILLLASTLWWDGTYDQKERMIHAVALQTTQNSELRENVTNLRMKADGMAHDWRTREREVRNQLGMLKPNEQIIIFSEK